MNKDQEAKFNEFMEEYKKQMFILMDTAYFRSMHKHINWEDALETLKFKESHWNRLRVDLGGTPNDLIGRCDIKSSKALQATLKTFKIKPTYKAMKEYFNV